MIRTLKGSIQGVLRMNFNGNIPKSPLEFSNDLYMTPLVFIATKEVGTIISPLFNKKRMELEESKWFLSRVKCLIKSRTSSRDQVSWFLVARSSLLPLAVGTRPGLWEVRAGVMTSVSAAAAHCLTSTHELTYGRSYKLPSHAHHYFHWIVDPHKEEGSIPRS